MNRLSVDETLKNAVCGYREITLYGAFNVRDFNKLSVAWIDYLERNFQGHKGYGWANYDQVVDIMAFSGRLLNHPDEKIQEAAAHFVLRVKRASQLPKNHQQQKREKAVLSRVRKYYEKTQAADDANDIQQAGKSLSSLYRQVLNPEDVKREDVRTEDLLKDVAASTEDDVVREIFLSLMSVDPTKRRAAELILATSLQRKTSVPFNVLDFAVRQQSSISGIRRMAGIRLMKIVVECCYEELRKQIQRPMKALAQGLLDKDIDIRKEALEVVLLVETAEKNLYPQNKRYARSLIYGLNRIKEEIEAEKQVNGRAEDISELEEGYYALVYLLGFVLTTERKEVSGQVIEGIHQFAVKHYKDTDFPSKMAALAREKVDFVQSNLSILLEETLSSLQLITSLAPSINPASSADPN